MVSTTQTRGLNLLIPERTDVEQGAVARAFEKSGGTVHRIGRFRDPPKVDPSGVRVYGSTSFYLVLQQKLGFNLSSPDDKLLLSVPRQQLKRKLALETLRDSLAGNFPRFIKPVTPMIFRASFFSSRELLSTECRDLSPDMLVFASEPVNMVVEVRTFLLDGELLDAAIYEGQADLCAARDFVEELQNAMKLPPTLVIDVGLISKRGWAVVEFNASWGAGLNGCSAEKVLPPILAASPLPAN
jgi:hypothetical protein